MSHAPKCCRYCACWSEHLKGICLRIPKPKACGPLSTSCYTNQGFCETLGEIPDVFEKARIIYSKGLNRKEFVMYLNGTDAEIHTLTIFNLAKLLASLEGTRKKLADAF